VIVTTGAELVIVTVMLRVLISPPESVTEAVIVWVPGVRTDV